MSEILLGAERGMPAALFYERQVFAPEPKAAAQQDYQHAQQLGVTMEPDDAKLMGQ